jgi:CdiI N-terminal domain
MFRVRVFTPPALNEEGLAQAGAELRLGSERFGFLVDLSHWQIADYQRQWQAATKRLLHGAPSTALMTAYRGPGDATHFMWGVWRDAEHVYVQQHSVLARELDSPFDPDEPHAHLGERIATSKHALPIPEWRVDLVHVYAAAMGIRWPLYPF